MNTLQQWFQGRKTYLTCVTVGVLLFGSWQGWWRLPAEIYAGLAALAAAFLRAGIASLQGPPPTGSAGIPAGDPPPPAPPGAPAQAASPQILQLSRLYSGTSSQSGDVGDKVPPSLCCGAAREDKVRDEVARGRRSIILQSSATAGSDPQIA